MIKAGRYTAALLLLIVGGLLIWDQLDGTSAHTQYLVQWWPLLFIVWGVEYILLILIYRTSERRMKLDISGVFLSVMLSAIVFGVTQPAFMSQIWNKLDFKIQFDTDQKTAQWAKVDKPVQEVALSSEIKQLQVKNEFGDVVVQYGDVEKLQIKAAMRIDSTHEEAERIANESNVRVEEVAADHLLITANPKELADSGKDGPKMNLVITVPKQSELDLDVNVVLGDIDIEGFQALNTIKLYTASGDIDVEHVAGKVYAETLLGDVSISAVEGGVEMVSKSGDLNVSHVTEGVTMNALNGDIRVEEVNKEIIVDTKSGDINIAQANERLKAVTLAGDITISSSQVGGDWDVQSLAGDLTISLPKDGNYSLDAKTIAGELSGGDFNVSSEQKQLLSQSGTGQYKVRIQGMGDISLGQKSN